MIIFVILRFSLRGNETFWPKTASNVRRKNALKNCEDIVDCSGRREFLVRSFIVAGGLVLGLGGKGFGNGRASDDVLVPVGDDSPLKKIGGSVVVDSPKGKIIVVRTGESSYSAFSALCTHKRGVVKYDAEKKIFHCPLHGSEFDGSNGSVVHGPAQDPLPAFKANGTNDSVTVVVGS